MYLRDFGDEPSCGNLQFATYLKKKKVSMIQFKINSVISNSTNETECSKLITWWLVRPSFSHFLRSPNKSFLSLVP